MSESSIDRSKRMFLKHLSKYEWNYQISIFYQNYADSFHAFEHSQLIRRRLRREYPKQAFLWRLAVSRVESRYIEGLPSEYKFKTVVLPYHTFLTNVQTMGEEFGDFVEALIGCEIYPKKRSFSLKRKEHYYQSVKDGKPFDLAKHLAHNGKINRFSLVNKNHATPDMLHGDLWNNPYPWKEAMDRGRV